MKRIRNILILLGFWILAGAGAYAQNPACNASMAGDQETTGTIFFNFGSVTNAVNNKNRHNSSVGELMVGTTSNQATFANLGFWSRFLLPPAAPVVTATQGELLDRIQLTWAIDPLSPTATEGFHIYRDGIYLDGVDRNARSYNDFNVIAGVPYNYEIRGVNSYGEGYAGKALGFQVPNGVVTGQVLTLNGSPVPDALVTLMPMQGFSARFGPTAGAFSDSSQYLPAAGSAWSLTFWIRTDVAAADAGILKLEPFPLYIQAINSAGGHEGVSVSTTDAPFLTGMFPDSAKNGWHHVALTFDNGQGRLYLDGTLAAMAPMSAIPSATAMSLGSRTGNDGWTGRIDELRIYHRRLDEIDLDEVMEGTATSATPELKYYWKMDEEQGVKTFDMLNRVRIFFCGATFDPDRPPVRTSGLTNEEGYYKIESASYGTGTTFLAKPSKNFYAHRSLKFTRSDNDYATLPDFSLTQKSTIELWVNSAGPDGPQCLLSKKWGVNEFRLMLIPNGLDNQVRIYLNGNIHNFGNLGNGYQHLAFTLDSASGNVTVYKNGALAGAAVFPGVSGNWSDTTQAWVLGARESGSGQTDHFGGLIDEVAVYDTTLQVAEIAAHAQASRDPLDRGLRIWFALDEGSGDRLNNAGSVLTDAGQSFGVEWSAFCARQTVSPHVFTPATRQVTLNPSVTSVDQVDFIDRSTVAVSGYVRFAGTDCFAQGVEILVNGESFNPAIFTDSTGRFVIDFDPGTTAQLTPKFGDHKFSPAFWDVTNVVNPIAGVLFYDTEKRKVKGQVAGGLCKAPILVNPGSPSGTVCRVKVSSKNGCLERILTLTDEDGTFEFDNLPPMEMTVAVIEHSDPNIKTAFQVQGGSQVDLSNRDTILEFIYFAQPEIQITLGLEPFDINCPTIVLDQGTTESVELRLVEKYYSSAVTTCTLDSADFRIVDGLAGIEVDTQMSGGKLIYKTKVGAPNPSPPFLKTIQFIATTPAGNETSLSKQVLVTGILAKLSTFTTTTPQIPVLVLHDPPGDGSYAYLEKDSSVCMNMGFETAFEAGGGASSNFNLLPKVEITFPGAPTVEVGPILGGSASFNVSMNKVSTNDMEVCLTANQRISTSADQLIVGGEQGGDVFMGGALNIIFGNADQVTFNDTFCMGNVDQIITVTPGSFATTYMYSEFQIANNTIRYLENIINSIKNDPAQSPADTLEYYNSLVQWEKILMDNKVRKERAKFIRNLSFDAGVEYEYSETADTAYSEVHTEELISVSDLAVKLGIYLNDAGYDASVNLNFSNISGTSISKSSGVGLTTGYVLADDEPGDAFTIDVGMDSVYKTPVFNLKAGQSSCPWEPGTANREGPNLQLAPGYNFTAVDIPANDPAVFQFLLGNQSASNEDWTYGFGVVEGSNPDGAVIKLNGSVLNSTHQYIIPYGTSTPVTVTIERGPVKYDYDSLQIALYSVCEYDRNFALSLPLDGDPRFFSSFLLGAHFIEPCSEVEISEPQQDWVIHPDTLPGDENILRITLSDYNENDDDLERIRVQYRRSDGDGAWINAGADILKADLGSVFTQFFWNTNSLDDGPYEVRAVAICTGDAADKPGYSHVIKGRIERQPPSLVGTPEPSDGVYQVGDEISFTFNKPVNCNKLIQADIQNENNVGLYDATTSTLIDANITCVDNKIVIDPLFQNKFYENHILRAELHNIQDLTGNVLTGTEWEFYVDRNELAWLTDSIGLTKYADETKTITAKIHNRGGYPVPFSIQNVPAWVHVTPNAGTLVPNEIRDIQFTVDSTLALGLWADSIILRTETGQNPFFMGGDEGLPLGVRVICRPPEWNINPSQYSLTMNLAVRLEVDGLMSDDPEDQIGVFIAGQLRGTGKLQYVPAFDYWVAFLTVYGESVDAGKPLVFEIFDASECLRYPATLAGNYTFTSNAAVGSAGSPGVVISSSMLLRDIPVKQGWNWISFNLGFPDPAINAALANYQATTNDLIKDQTKFGTFANPGWNGALKTLNNKSLYMYQAVQPNTIKIVGNPLTPASESIPVVAGWNWIGYVPNYPLPVNSALATLTAQAGDIIKSQTGFAQYIDGSVGWVGNLSQMSPPNGYLLKTAQAGTLTYPPQPLAPEIPAESRGGKPDDPPPASFWTVDATQYEHSMTLIGMFQADGANATAATMELGAFAGDEIRGAAQPVYVEPLQSYLFFLTMYANTSNELLHFKLFDSATGEMQYLSETMYFSPNYHQGSVDDPVPFTLQLTGTDDLAAVPSFDVQPNPFHTETMFRFVLTSSQEVSLMIAAVGGREVASIRTNAREGLNVVTWDGLSNSGIHLDSGVYFARLKTDQGIATRKVVLQR